MWVTACPYGGFNVDNLFLDIDVGELAEPCLGADVANLFLDIDVGELAEPCLGADVASLFLDIDWGEWVTLTWVLVCVTSVYMLMRVTE